MILILENGYPHPWVEDKPGWDSREHSLVLEGVVHFEWKYTLTVEFENFEAYSKAMIATGWKNWSNLVLEAKYAADEGFETPAIIAGNMAYCSFMLMAE